jgi:phospholipid/cholesterol/gamma-HCH transport system permease protein
MAEPKSDMHKGQLTVYLQGRLDEQQSTEIFQWAGQRLEERDVSSLVLDLKEVSFINTAGIALLRALEQRCSARAIGLRFENLPETARRFLDHRGPGPAPHDGAQASPRPDWVSRLGMWTIRVLGSAAGVVSFIGRFTASCFLLLRNPRQLRLGDFFLSVQEVGTGATLLICVINGLTGMILVFQGEGIAARLGSPLYVATMVARSITAQMGPVLTAILVAGRTGTSFAAKIGTMKVRQELEVLEVMNFNIFTFLVLPRVLAVTLATPLLTMLADASGIIGGMMTGMAFMDISPTAFINEVHATLKPTDIYTGLIKGAGFGAVIGLTGCFHGLKTGSTAHSVGLRTTSAVVSSIFIIILADTVFAALFNKFGW